jgi:hypothetical protein
VVIEAGVITGYVIAWAVRKVRRAGNRLDATTDTVVDGLLDRLDGVVTGRLGGHPVLAELVEEAGSDGGDVSDLTRQQVELALTAAAAKDDEFGQEITDLLAQVQEAEQTSGTPVITGPVFTGDAYALADNDGIAFGQVGGDVNLNQGPAGPSGPGRPGH